MKMVHAVTPLLLAGMIGCDDAAGPGAASRPTVIAFMSQRDGAGNNEIYTMGPAGTDEGSEAAPLRLTHNPGNDGAPDLSPDGRRILFHSVRPEHSTNEIYVMNVDGSAQTRLTEGSASSTFPAWSPDGRRIAFTRGAPATATVRGSRQIWIMNADATGLKQLTAEGDNYRPNWSPDGRSIVFASDRHGDFAGATPRERGPNFGLHDIYAMNADGSAVQRLTSNATSLDGEPVYSPDGRQIAFRSRRDTDRNGDNYCGIFVMNRDGSNPRNLTPIPPELTWNQWCNAFPAWTPDGREILFHALRPTPEFGLQLEIYSVNVQRGETTRLTYNASPEQVPSAR